MLTLKPEVIHPFVTATFDIETTALEASYGRLLCCCIKLSNEAKIRTIRCRKLSQERSALKEIRDVLESADILVGWNCVSPETPVLTADLRWVPAGELEVGQKLAAFSEKPEPRRKWKQATVTDNSVEREECSRIWFSDGSSTIASNRHPMLTAMYANRIGDQVPNGYKWSRVENLIPQSTSVRKFFNPAVDPINEYDAGWLAGIFDGEGTWSNSGGTLNFTQQAGPVLDYAVRVLEKYNIPYNLRQYDNNYSHMWQVAILGGVQGHLEFLRIFRPIRLLDKMDFNNLGALKSDYSQTLRVEKIESIGKQDISVLSTDTMTYIADGFGAHNSIRFDVAFINARLWQRKMKTLPTMWHIDLMYQCAKLRTRGNSLDGAARDAKLPVMKHNVSAWEWVEAGQGEGPPSEESFNEIVKHCEHDVLMTEQMLLEYKPMIKAIQKKG